MKKIVLGTLILSVAFCGCGDKIVKTTKTPSTGTVISKDYVESYTTFTMIPMRCGKITTFIRQPHFHEEEFNVTIESDKNIKTFNSKPLYESVEVGDAVKIDVFYDTYESGTIMRHFDLPSNDEKDK